MPELKKPAMATKPEAKPVPAPVAPASAPAAPTAKPEAKPEPEPKADRLAALEKEVAGIKDLMRANGWTVKK